MYLTRTSQAIKGVLWLVLSKQRPIGALDLHMPITLSLIAVKEVRGSSGSQPVDRRGLTLLTILQTIPADIKAAATVA